MARGSRTRRGDPAKAIGYIRVSTEDQALGAEAQRQALAAWASTKGLTLVEVHEDIGVSGTTEMSERPGLLRALASVQQHRAGSLVAVRRDRFARDIQVILALEARLKQLGAMIRTEDSATDAEGASGDLVRIILDGVARFERTLIQDRTSSALRASQRAGRAAGGAPPFGWELVRVADDSERGFHNDLVPLPTEQAVLARMRALRAQGLSYGTIARVLQQDGQPCRGKAWHRNTVLRALERQDLPTISDTPGGVSEK